MLKKIPIPPAYFKKVNDLLMLQYCITFTDTGYEEGEWINLFTDLSPEESVLAYAAKYDLTPRPNSCFS